MRYHFKASELVNTINQKAFLIFELMIKQINQDGERWRGTKVERKREREREREGEVVYPT